MKNILKILIATLIFLNSISLYGTIQTSEKLIIGIDTFKIDQFPFEPFLERDRTILPNTEKKNEDGTSEICISSGCWRGYIGTWSIINDSLFLVSLIPPCGMENFDKNPFDLEKVFNDKVTPNGVFAYWVNDILNTKCIMLPCDEPRESFVISNGKLVTLSSNDYIYLEYTYPNGFPTNCVLTYHDNENKFYNKFNWLIPSEFHLERTDYLRIQAHLLNYNFEKGYNNIGTNTLRPLVTLEVYRNDNLVKSEMIDHFYKFFMDLKQLFNRHNINNKGLNAWFENKFEPMDFD